MNGYLKEINRNKYLTLVLTNESKKIIKKFEELGSKLSLIKFNLKVEFNLDDDLPLNTRNLLRDNSC